MVRLLFCHIWIYDAKVLIILLNRTQAAGKIASSCHSTHTAVPLQVTMSMEPLPPMDS